MNKLICVAALALFAGLTNLPAQKPLDTGPFQVQLWTADGATQYCDYLVISIVNTVWITGTHGGCVTGLVAGTMGAFKEIAPFGSAYAGGGNVSTNAFTSGSHFFLLSFAQKTWALYHNEGAGMQYVNGGMMKFAAPPPAGASFSHGPSSDTPK